MQHKITAWYFVLVVNRKLMLYAYIRMHDDGRSVIRGAKNKSFKEEFRRARSSPIGVQRGEESENQVDFLLGNGQKRELPVVSWPETGGQNYEGSKHSIWAHVIGQRHLPPVSGRTPTGTSRFSLHWSAPTRFWPHFLHFVALHQSIRSDLNKN